MIPINVTDPGVVNVEDQAYPNPPGTSQSLPTPSLAFASDFAAPLIPGGSQALPRPTEVNVSQFPALQPSFSRGSAAPEFPTHDITFQNLQRFNPAEYLVTESGSFQTNNTLGDLVQFLSTFVVVADSGLPTETYQIFLGPAPGAGPVNLGNYGLDLTNLIVSFPNQAPARAPENVPQRAIISWSKNWILVSRYDAFGNSLANPGAASGIGIAILRDGASVINDIGILEVDVLILPPPPIAVTTPAPNQRFLGNLSPADGVVVPFVGSGVRTPPFLGTFEVENQVPPGNGLPVNVFQ